MVKSYSYPPPARYTILPPMFPGWPSPAQLASGAESDFGRYRTHVGDDTAGPSHWETSMLCVLYDLLLKSFSMFWWRNLYCAVWAEYDLSVDWIASLSWTTFSRVYALNLNSSSGWRHGHFMPVSVDGWTPGPNIQAYEPPPMMIAPPIYHNPLGCFSYGTTDWQLCTT